MIKMIQPRKWMLDLLYDSKDIVSNKIISSTRWSLQYELVFNHEGKLWITFYSRGATEMQDESPWEYEAEVTCYEAETYLTTAYRPKEQEAAQEEKVAEL